MGAKVLHPVNTLERAIGLAQAVSRELAHREPKTCRKFRMFQALTRDEREAFGAFIVWQARARAM
jgi:hypothetical protein